MGGQLDAQMSEYVGEWMVGKWVMDKLMNGYIVA